MNMVLPGSISMQGGVSTVGSGGTGPGLWMAGLRLRASSTSVAQSSCGYVGDVLYMVVTWGGGGLVGMVGGCDILALCIMLLVVGVMSANVT